MDKKQRESGRPMAIAIGAHLVCCLGLVLIATGAISITGWSGGFDGLAVLGVAAAGGALIFLFRRLRKTALTETKRAPRRALKGDQ